MKPGKPRVFACATMIALVGTLGALGTQGCGRAAPDTAATSSAPSSSQSEAGRSARVTGPRQRVVTVHTRIDVTSVPDAVRTIRREVVRAGGYVETATQSLEDDHSAAMTLRVPSERLDSFRAALARLGVVEHDEERVDDVTEQHADLDARLRNARAEEQRLLEILSTRAGTLADVLAVERRLAETRGTIEQLDAQMRLLQGQIAFAKLDVTLREDPTRIAVGPVDRLMRAGGAGVVTAWEVSVGAVALGLRIGPTIAVFGSAVTAVVMFVRMLRRRTRRRPATAA